MPMYRGAAMVVMVLLLGVASSAASPSEKLDRGLVALRGAGGSVYLGWRLLASDPPDAGFHVYRQGEGEEPRRLTAEPLGDRTNLVDRSPGKAGASRYAVSLVSSGREGPPCRAIPVIEVTPGVAPHVRIRLEGDDAAQKVAVADLDGDGRYDYVTKGPDFNVDPYHKPGYWKKSRDTYKIEAYRGDGSFLWRHDMGWSIEEGIWYSPYVVHDLDGDGRAEVYTKAGEGDPRDPDGRVTSGAEWLIQIDGLTGEIRRRIPWPDRSGYESYNYYSRNLLGVAYLDGRRPHLIVERGTYTQIKVEAYDPELRLVWRWNSRDEKERYNGQGMHGMHAADVDGDGRDEIILGGAVLDDSGRGLWTTGMGHPDICYVGDLDPGRPGLEIFYGFETRQKTHGVCLVDARTGAKLWAHDGPTRHVHSTGMAADITAAHPGVECYCGEKDGSQFWLYAAGGERIGSEEIGGLAPRAAHWDGDPQKELILGRRITDYRGESHDTIEGRVVTIADCLGDWREEIIASLPGEIRIYTTTVPSETRRPCLMEDRLYRLDVAMVSMGYFFLPQSSRDPFSAAPAPEGDRVLFEDPFSGKLGDGWSWVRENSGGWRVDRGALLIRVEPGGLWGRGNSARNVLVRPAPDPLAGTVIAEVRVADEPTRQFEQAGIAWYHDDSNMVKLVKERVNGKPWVVMGREETDRTRTLAKVPLDTAEVGLRFRVRGQRVTGQFRPGGEGDWKDVASCDAPGRGQAKISLHAYNGPVDAEHWARFTNFRVLRAAER